MRCGSRFWTVWAVSFISFGCGQASETVTIDVAGSVRGAIAEAAPTGEYRFLALREFSPKSIEDMMKARLFVCGDIGNQVGLKVVTASLSERRSLLFGSIHRFYINTNLISGALSATETTTITPDSGGAWTVVCEQTVHGRDYPIDTLVGRCVQEMRKNQNSVLLIKRKVRLDRDLLSQMVEIAFR